MTEVSSYFPVNSDRKHAHPYMESDLSFVDEKTGRASLDPILQRQANFRPLSKGQDSLLFEKVIEHISDDPSIQAFPDKIPTVILHHDFVTCWQNMQLSERRDSICHRTFWLGESWLGGKIDSALVAKALVQGLSERVKRFKKNIGMNLLIPYVAEVEQKKPHTYKGGQGYQEWFFDAKGNSRYDWQVVNDFAQGKVIDPILDVYAFGYRSDVLKADEIELIYEEIKKNPEPKVVFARTDDNSDKFDKLAGAITKLVEVQTQKSSGKHIEPAKELCEPQEDSEASHELKDKKVQPITERSRR